MSGEEPLGREYTLHEEIGRGPHAVVRRATGRRGGPPFAAKLLRPDLAADRRVRDVFLREEAALRALDHPSIVGLRDLVVERGRLALVTDLVDGQNLRHHLADRGFRLTGGEAATIAAQAAAALAAAHAQGIVHLGLTPENIITVRATDPTVVRVTDFGMTALLLDADRAPTSGSASSSASGGPAPSASGGPAPGGTVADGNVAGTPGYLAPEVRGGGQGTTAADVYALGVILVELVEGILPDPADADILRPRLPQQLQGIVRACLAADPRSRPSAGALAVRLRAAVAALADQPHTDLPFTAHPPAGQPFVGHPPAGSTGSTRSIGTAGGAVSAGAAGAASDLPAAGTGGVAGPWDLPYGVRATTQASAAAAPSGPDPAGDVTTRPGTIGSGPAGPETAEPITARPGTSKSGDIWPSSTAPTSATPGPAAPGLTRFGAGGAGSAVLGSGGLDRDGFGGDGAGGDGDGWESRGGGVPPASVGGVAAGATGGPKPGRRRRGPLLTLAAGAVVAAVLLGLNVNAAAQDRADRAAANAVPPTAAATTTPPAATGSATPPEQAPAAPPPATTTPTKPPADRTRATFAGRVDGGGGTLAISLRDGVAIAYICDGKRVEAWLKGTAADGKLSLTGDDATLTATFDARRARGTVTVDGRSSTFSIAVTKKPSGLYRAAASVRNARVVGSWIVLPDGSQVGVLTEGGVPGPAPALDVAGRSTTVDGTAVAASTIDVDSGDGF